MQLKPDVRIVAGGYDPSLAPETYEACADIDYLVRGEGEITFRDLLRAWSGQGDVAEIAGLSIRAGDRFVHTTARPVAKLASEPLALPNRAARVLTDYTLLGRRVDVVETSRGCTYDCSFCSIIEMRGRNFHPYPVERVLADISDARRHGAQAIFLVDDNITLDVQRFESLCRAIIDSGYQDTDFIVQAMTSPIAEHGATLAPLMRRAGFRYVFLGIENIARIGSRVPQGAGEEHRAPARAVGRQRDDRGHRSSPSKRHVRRRRPDRRQPRRHAASRSTPTCSSRGNTSTGRTSSIRRRIRGRR